jgi:hypothetical protein
MACCVEVPEVSVLFTHRPDGGAPHFPPGSTRGFPSLKRLYSSNVSTMYQRSSCAPADRRA